MNKYLLIAGIALAASNASAALITADLSDFSGAETVIDFNSVTGYNTEITNQFVSSGVTFSGGLFSDLNGNYGATGFDSSVKASNFYPCCNDITVDFSFDVNIFGLNIITNDGDQLNLTAYLDGVNVGSQIFTTERNVANFFGIQDVGAFDRVVIDVFGPVNGAFASDNYRFEAVSVSVPEPASIALLGLGLAGLGFSRRKTKA